MGIWRRTGIAGPRDQALRRDIPTRPITADSGLIDIDRHRSAWNRYEPVLLGRNSWQNDELCMPMRWKSQCQIDGCPSRRSPNTSGSAEIPSMRGSERRICRLTRLDDFGNLKLARLTDGYGPARRRRRPTMHRTDEGNGWPAPDSFRPMTRGNG